MEHLIVDTDPGIDDAAALFFALASPEVRIDLITTVFGNVSVEQATVNARRLLALASRSAIPVRSGASKPLRGAPKFAKHIHGSDGLGDLDWPVHDTGAAGGGASEAIVDGATHWLFDTNLQKYVLYGRTKKVLPEVEKAWSTNTWFKNWFSGRAVARIESTDFVHWDFTRPDTAPVVLMADLDDKPGTEIYSMKVFRYGSAYIGLVQIFDATPDESTLHIELATSRDGVHFTRLNRGKAFIGLGGVGSWDRFNLSLANNDPIAVGDELRIYYGGRLYRHGPYSGPDKGPERGGIGFATIAKDRFVALEASFDGGEIVTKPLLVKGEVLHLNARANFGKILVEAVDEVGKTVATSKPIQRDALDIAVEWQQRPDFAEPVVLRLKLENAQLFAVWATK